MSHTSITHVAFGVRFSADFALPPLPPAPQPGAGLDVAIVGAGRADIEAAWSGAAGPAVWRTAFRGLGAFSLEIGRAGDHLLSFDGDPKFHIDAAVGRVRCRLPYCEDPGPQRFLLDTVLWHVSLLRGHQSLHASAVVWDSGAVAFAGPQGVGKTSLLAEFLRRGHTLFSDDVVALARAGGSLIAHPGPPLLNIPLEGAGAVGTLGMRLAVFEDDEREAWSALTVQARPAPLQAVILLRRSDEGDLVLHTAEATIFDLLINSICLRHVVRAQRDRFAIMADVLESVPILELRFGPGHPPTALADRIERDLDALMHAGHA